MKSFKKLLYLTGAMCFVLTGVASATPMGVASITNCTPSGGVTVSANSITWLPVAGTNLGCIATGLPTSITYTGGTFTSGIGTISDLPGGSINPFITLAGGVLSFALGAFEAPTPTDGVCSTTVALASGHSCVTAAGSPFLLISQGTTTAVSLNALGIVTDTGDASNTTWLGLFTTQLASNTAQIATQIDPPSGACPSCVGGSITNTYSATLILGAPEPATVSMFLLAGVALIGIGRKRFNKF